MQATGLFEQPAQSRKLKSNIVHPKLADCLEVLQREYGHYKYTVYRCANKIVRLQKLLHTSRIPYKLVLAVMDRHGMRYASANLMIPPFQLTSFIHDIYFACEKLGHFSKLTTTFKLTDAVSLLSNLFWSIFDPQHRHSISLLEIKCTFLLLCQLYTQEYLILECYHLLKDDKSQCVTKLVFEQFLHVLMKFITFIGEGNAYGAHNMQMCLQQCFDGCSNATGLTEQQFKRLWLTTPTRFIIYANLVALIKRIEDTEQLIHSSSCASCHAQRIIGIRFKCQNCKQLNLCMKCFASGYASNRHEAGHRMFEVFAADDDTVEMSSKRFTHLFAKLCTVFCSKKQRLQLQSQQTGQEDTKHFCNTNENETELISIGINGNTNDTASVNLSAIEFEDTAKLRTASQNIDANALQPALTGLSNTAANALNASERLQRIIDRLQQQNTKLEEQLQCFDNTSAEEILKFLSAHKHFLLQIISEMRNLSRATQKSSCSLYPAFSTPNHSLEHNNEQCSVAAKATATISNNSHLTHSLDGADINRSYLDANKSDYSLNDISVWFNQRQQQEITTQNVEVSDMALAAQDTEMCNFKLLLHKVKEIVQHDVYSHSYSNGELLEATQNLENVLGSIIRNEDNVCV